MKWGRASLYALAMLLLASGTVAAAVAPPDPLTQGLEALDAKSFKATNVFLEKALVAARQSGDRSREAEVLFYLGLARQQEAAGVDRELLQQAIRFYEEALALRSELGQPTGPILNNLAQAHMELGDLARATELLAQAAAGGERGAALYSSNYAAILEKQGKSDEAADVYRRAAESNPANPIAQWNALRLMGEDLLPYLRCQLVQGQVDLAGEQALRLLEEGQRSFSDRAGLLAIVAESLARQLGDPRDSPIAGRLAELNGDPELGPGIAELRQVLAGALDRPCCAWWTSLGGISPDIPQALQDLLLALGRVSPPDWAERYFVQALDLGGPEMSARVFLELAELFSRTGQIAKLDRLARQRTADLMDAKMTAYRRASWREAYHLHRALGVIYANLGRWGASHTVDSAIFQLEHAREAASRYNAEVSAAPPAPCGASLEPQGPVTVEPGLIALLAEGYEKVGRLQDAVRARLDSAEGYKRLKDEKTARIVLAPVLKLYDSLPAAEQARVQAVQRDI